MQFSGDQIYYTSLLEYKTHGEAAKPHFVVTHYKELSDSKGIILMLGEMGDNVKNTLQLEEAQNLVYQTQLFYKTGGPETLKLVEIFSLEPESFDIQNVIACIESLAP